VRPLLAWVPQLRWVPGVCTSSAPVDAAVPAVPLRHDVLSFPFERLPLAATNPHVLRALCRINVTVTAKHPRRPAAVNTVECKTHAGALTFVHRFGSSLSPQLNLHVCVPHGVHVERDNETRSFCPARSVSQDDLCELVQ